MKRSGELQFLAAEMESAQRKFEAKAAQFREISTRMRRGMVNAKRSGELERLVGEMTEVLETQASRCTVMHSQTWENSALHGGREYPYPRPQRCPVWSGCAGRCW